VSKRYSTATTPNGRRTRIPFHVRKGDALAKFWLKPIPEIADSYKLSAQELHELLDIAIHHEKEIARYWNEYFGN